MTKIIAGALAALSLATAVDAQPYYHHHRYWHRHYWNHHYWHRHHWRRWR